MPTKITAYKCAYCNYVSRTMCGIMNHERACKYNPDRKNCHSCKWCGTHTVVIKPDEPGEEFYECDIVLDLKPEQIAYKEMFCRYFNSPIRDKPYNRECETDDWEEPIPGTCWNYEPKEREERKDEI